MADSCLLSGDTLLPDLLRAHPQTRSILDRYGLQGCGGTHGPHETLTFFARAHDVPLAKLLDELKAASRQRGEEAAMPPPELSPADTIYRPFFKAGIVTVLTVGALWGVFLLIRIALAGSFTAVGMHEINAHGHAQIFGWVGLFVMGFAYQAFPRFKHTSLRHASLARFTLWMMLTGIGLRCLLEPLVEAWPAVRPLAVAAGPIEIAAASFFIFILLSTWRGSGKRLAVYDAYILSGLGWFLVQTVYESVYFAATAYAPDREALLGLLATWQAPLRDLQIHGFALLIILGVSQRIFPHFYGFREGSPRLAARVLVGLNLCVAAEATGLILMRTAGHAWAALWYAGALGLLAGSVLLVRDWRIFSRCEEPDRSLKFLRAAYVWLFLSLGMLALLPLHQFGLLRALAPESHAAQIGFSHAYYGAIRHAITVGFVSMMIVGVAAKVVPTLGGWNVAALSPLWGVFVLLNTGCSIRVAGQSWTDFSGRAFPVAGVSGLLELTALALWSVHLWRVMHNVSPSEPHPESESADSGHTFTGSDTVGSVLKRRPDLLPTFLEFGFTPLASPVARTVLVSQVTLKQACRHMEVDLPSFLRALNLPAAQESEATEESVSCP